MKRFLILPLLITAAAVQAQTQTPLVITPISITSPTQIYRQNFNTDEAAPEGPGLATGIRDTTSANTPPGWGFVENGTGANALYTIRDGATSIPDTYSFGTTTGVAGTSSTERAFGEITGTAAEVQSMIGAQFTNNSGSVINSITISFTGEQWRSYNGTGDRLDFKYSTTAAGSTVGSLTAGTFTDVSALDFNALVTGSNAGINGNSASNRTFISAKLTGLNLAVGETLTIRWDGVDVTGNDAGLAIDDVVVTVPEPSTWAAGLVTLGGMAFMQRRRFARLLKRSA